MTCRKEKFSHIDALIKVSELRKSKVLENESFKVQFCVKCDYFHIVKATKHTI